MNYVFKGNLRGFYCGDCYDFLYNAKVRIYSATNNEQLTHMTNAKEKETFHQRSEEELQGLSNRLIAETMTDEAGNFTFEFSEKQYQGEAFEIDFECGTVPIKFGPKNPPKPKGPLQFHITTLQPKWQEANDQRTLSAYWEYAISQSFWCWLLRMFGWYVICGRVVVCNKNIPLSKVKVKAFDVDLIQDDALGEAITDAGGHFKIYYTQADFSKTIFNWLNIEWPAGPDIYFSVEDSNGVVLLKEPRSKGHTPGRENVGNCMCVSLCVDVNIDVPQPEPIPAFLKIGGYDYDTQIMSHVGESGLTTGNYAFFGGLRLNGILSRTLGNVAMEYCFEYTKQYDAGGNPINWNRVLADKIIGTDIGFIEKAKAMPPDLNHTTPWFDVKKQACIVSNVPVGTALQVPIVADGWILVPQQNDNPLNELGSGMFVPNGNQIILNSELLDTFAPIDLTGLIAGDSSTSTGKALGNDEVFAIRMLVRQQGNNATITEGGRCTRVAINNTKYTGMEHHPEWGPKAIVPEFGVGMLDIAQLRAAGCAKITNQVDVLYTCAHPNLGSIAITMTGPTGTITLPTPAVITPDMAGTIVHTFGPADPLCAYLVTLETTYLLTTGDSNLSSVYDQIAFCR